MNEETDKATDKEIERRVDMKLMAKQVAETHSAIYGNRETGEEGWLCAKVNKNTSDIKQIKTIWSTLTVLGTTLLHFLTRKL